MESFSYVVRLCEILVIVRVLVFFFMLVFFELDYYIIVICISFVFDFKNMLLIFS